MMRMLTKKKKKIKEEIEKKEREKERRLYEDNDDDSDDDNERFFPQQNYNYNKMDNNINRYTIKRNVKHSGSSQPTYLYLCKECSRNRCIFCRAKRGSIQVNPRAHKDCQKKNYQKFCFICDRTVKSGEYLSFGYYCHDCERKYKNRNMRKFCPVCKDDVYC